MKGNLHARRDDLDELPLGHAYPAYGDDVRVVIW